MEAVENALKPRVSESYVAKVLDVSIHTVRRWRASKDGFGPPWIKIGSVVRYDVDSVIDWLKSRPVGGGGIAHTPKVRTRKREELCKAATLDSTK
jgi:Helix-turn-helix domain